MQSLRASAVDVLYSLSDEQVFDFIRHYADDDTIAEVECHILINVPNTKKYSSFDELLADVENEPDDED